jgi:hypothetical protein
MDVEVKIGGQNRMLTVAEYGRLCACRFCGKLIVWGQDAAGKFYPLNWNPTYLHFDTCERRQKDQRRQERARQEAEYWRQQGHRFGGPPVRPASESQAGIEMTQKMWRHLLRLVHPDKHHGGEDERLANEATRWLLEQKPHLKKKLYLKKTG